jgi:sorting nexin-41/42
LEQNWAEPLHEYTQFASIIKKLLAYRHQKHVQYEMTQDTLEAKKDSLEDLEKSEREANRLEEALGRGRVPGPSVARRQREEGEATAATATTAATADGEGVTSDEGAAGGEGATSGDEEVEEAPSTSAYLPPHPGPRPPSTRRRAPGSGLLSALSYTLHGMMDVDPETARRNSITKTRETISQVCLNSRFLLSAYNTNHEFIQLEDALHLSAQDLKYSSSTIQADLDRFQRQKVADIREMVIAMAKSHRDWCQKVM